MSSRYRLIVFLVILLAAALIGFHYKSLANPGAEPARFRSQASQYLHLYLAAGNVVSDSVTISLSNDGDLFANHILNMHGYSYFNENITVKVTYSHPVSQRTVIMTSSSKPADTLEFIHTFQLVKPNFVETRIPSERFVVATQLLPDGPPSDHGQQSYLAFQDFESIPAIFQSNGSIYGHLPSMVIHSDPSGSYSTMSVKFGPKTGEILNADANGCFKRLSATGSGLTPLVGWKCFFELPQFSTAKYAASEDLRNIGGQLNSEQVAYMNPSTTSNNFDYAWRSTACCNLEPVFKLTDPTAADSQNKAAFTSGISFGVAGAALIAVFQELPKQFPWPRRKRRRKSPPQDA